MDLIHSAKGHLYMEY